jgi:hypothetical protein
LIAVRKKDEAKMRVENPNSSKADSPEIMARKLEILKKNYPAVYDRLENDYAA